MNACPVCEAPALSRLCEVCGHAFAPEASRSDVPLSPLSDLDVGLPAVGEVSVAPLFDLEPTRFQAAALPSSPLDADWERTRVAEVPDVVAGGLEELESGREATVSDRIPPSAGSVVCRYCRNVQTSGLLCDHCGMRLPWSAKATSVVPPSLDPDLLVRCPGCGIRTYQRERCAGCGSRLSVEG
jgi:hypothetical protein